MNQVTVLEDKSVAEILIHYLETMGVKHVFGIPGGAIAPYLKLLRRSSTIKFIMGCHEAGSAFMAEGYARVTGLPGVVFVTSGPGATNALTGVACAHSANSPVLLLSGQASTSYFHMGSIQESTNDGINVVEIFRHSTASSELVGNVNSFKGALLKTSRALMGRPRRAAHLSLPLDVSSTRIPHFNFPNRKEFFSLGSSFIDEAQMEEVFSELIAAERPLIFLGSGCREALRKSPARLGAFIEFLDTFGIPVVTSAQAKGIFPESHPLSLGVYGISGSEQSTAYIKEKRPDVLLVVGSSLGEWSTKSWDPSLIPSKKFFQVDINDRNIGRSFPVSDGIVGDAAACLDSIIRRGRLPGQKRAPSPAVEEIKNRISPFSSPEKRDSEDSPIRPQRLMRELCAISNETTSFFIDSGNCMSWAINYLCIDPPAELFVTTTVASMGWANGAVIGAKVGAPERTCICLTGDGSVLMNGAEIQTAARYKIGAVWVVLYDGALGMVNQGEAVTSNHEFSMEDGYYEFADLDLPAYARSLGARATFVTEAHEIRPALEMAIRTANTENTPFVVIVKIDPKELPPILNRFISLMKQTTQEGKVQ